jgi:ribosomal protein S12 methylthiotransferase accessory factor
MRKELRRAARAMGVTRIARVTGLDRAGVEVACSVRPGGHVLQIANGKGERAEDAELGALCEAAELWGAERVDPAILVHATARELGGRALDPADLPGAPGATRLLEARIAWRPARDLFTGAELLVPAQAAHCPPAGVPLGPVGLRWSSNGMGAHPDPRRALAHALLEAAERDGLSRALPHGWTRVALRRRKIDPASLPRRTARLVERLSAAGFAAHLFDLGPGPGWLDLPLAAALLADREEGPLPLTAGYACAERADDALAAALLEAAQSRLTDVHGAREDIAALDRGAALGLAREAALAGATVDASVVASRDALPLLERFRRAGFSRAAAVELAPAGFPLAIVKVLVPRMRVSELL